MRGRRPHQQQKGRLIRVNKRTLFLFVNVLFLLLLGCHTNKKKLLAGPLSEIKDFQVCYFFSPYEKYDRDLLFSTLVKCLKEIGTVEIVDNSHLTQALKTDTHFFISLGDYQEKNKGSIEIKSQVLIEANQFPINCTIWARNFDEGTQASYPFIENGKVSFKEVNEISNMDSQTNVQSPNNPVSVLTQLIENFGDEYFRCNSKTEKPVFYIYSFWQPPPPPL